MKIKTFLSVLIGVKLHLIIGVKLQVLDGYHIKFPTKHENGAYQGNRRSLEGEQASCGLYQLSGVYSPSPQGATFSDQRQGGTVFRLLSEQFLAGRQE